MANSRQEKQSEPKQIRTLWMHVKAALKKIRSERSWSFFLLPAIIVVLILGLQMAQYRHEPGKFALVLGCMFVFFFFVMAYAVLEAGQILRGHVKENSKLFRSTLGEEEFLDELRHRVRDKRES